MSRTQINGPGPLPRGWPPLEHPLYSILLILTVAVLLLVALRHGQEWDGDFELYLMNARNIVLGLPYSRTEYIYNAANAINPAAYPPGLPLLFAPVYALFGGVPQDMKIACVALLVLFLTVFLRIARLYVPISFALLLTAAVGLHPFVLDSENMAGSEFPFMFFCYAALWLLQRMQAEELPLSRAPLAPMALAAAALALAYLTRSIGVLIFPAVLFVSVVRSRAVVTPSTVAMAGAGVIIVGAHVLFPGDVGTYISYFHGYSLHRMIGRALRYASVVGFLLGKTTLLEQVASIMLDVLAVVGLASRLRRFTLIEVFFVMYLAFLVVYPIAMEMERYSMPIWPLELLYAAVGLDVACRTFPSPARLAVCCAVAATLVGLYCWQAAHKDFGPIPYSVDAAQSRELFTAIRQKVPQDGRLLARKPTIIGLYTDRQAAIWPDPSTDAEIWAYMRRVNIGYIVQNTSNLGEHVRADDELNVFVADNQSRLELVFANDWFRLYRVP